MLRWDRSCLEPFERARAEIEFVSGLLLVGAAQARRVIDAVGARSRQSFLLGDLKRFRRPASACERRQPHALLARASGSAMSARARCVVSRSVSMCALRAD